MSLESKIRSLKAHPLIQVLADNGGNPRTLVLIEPLWGVPYNLIAPCWSPCPKAAAWSLTASAAKMCWSGPGSG